MAINNFEVIEIEKKINSMLAMGRVAFIPLPVKQLWLFFMKMDGFYFIPDHVCQRRTRH